MKIRVLSCLLAGVLSLSLLLGACSQKPGETKKGPAFTLSDEEVVTMEKAADYLSYTAAEYNKEVPGKKELLTMASRAFGELPKPAGNNARLAPFDVDLSGVPQWALDDIKKLKEAGILVQNDLGITAKPMENRTDGKMEDAQTGDSGTDSDAVSQLDSVKDSVSEPSGEKEAVSQESADPSRSQKIEGSGLGLSIVRQIMEQYGGSVTVEDSNETGSTIVLRFICWDET
mgnify:FL=1